MCDMEEKEVRADLEVKIKEIVDDMVSSVKNRTGCLISSGYGVLEDHAQNNCNYVVPKAVAFAIMRDYLQRRALLSKEAKSLYKNYLILL